MSASSGKKSAKGGKKAIEFTVKLQVGAGSANPSPPIGPALGQYGVNIVDFCKQFNDKTQNLPDIEKGTPLTVEIFIFGDKSFKFVVKGQPVSVLLKKAMKLKKGSSNPNKDKVGTISKQQLLDIAKIKAADLTAANEAAAIRTIAGSAKSMGLLIEQ